MAPTLKDLTLEEDEMDDERLTTPIDPAGITALDDFAGSFSEYPGEENVPLPPLMAREGTPDFNAIGAVSELLKARSSQYDDQIANAKEQISNPYIQNASDNTLEGLGTLASLLGGALGGGKMGVVDSIPVAVQGSEDLVANTPGRKQDAALKQLAALELKDALQGKRELDRSGISGLNQVNKLAQQKDLAEQQIAARKETAALSDAKDKNKTERTEEREDSKEERKRQAEFADRVDKVAKETEPKRVPGYEFLQGTPPDDTKAKEASKQEAVYQELKSNIGQYKTFQQAIAAKRQKGEDTSAEELGLNNALLLTVKNLHKMGANFTRPEVQMVRSIIPSLDLDTAVGSLDYNNIVNSLSGSLLKKDSNKVLSQLEQAADSGQVAAMATYGYVNPRKAMPESVAKSLGVKTITKNGVTYPVGSNYAPILRSISPFVKSKSDLEAIQLRLGIAKPEYMRAKALGVRTTPLLDSMYLGNQDDR